MKSSVDRYILEPVIDDLREAFVKQIRSRVEFTCHCLIGIVRAIEKQYGPEAKEAARRGFIEHFAGLSGAAGKNVKKDFVQAFCKAEEGWAGTHEWERLIDTKDKVAYRFTRCMWAETFNRLGAPDIGHWFCDTDEPCAKAFNPKLKFKRTKTLMDKNKVCDHVFYRTT